MKLVDMPVLGTGALRRVGSSPTEGINLTICKLPVLITIVSTFRGLLLGIFFYS